MNDSASLAKNPHLLLEAARVLNAAGPPYENAAAAIAQAALQVRDLADADVREAITGDVAALYLSGRLPGGYEEALTLLAAVDDAATDSDKSGRLHLLRALAKGQKYTALNQAKAKMPQRADLDAEMEALKKQIRKDLEVAFTRNPNLKESNKPFWDPDATAVDFAEQEADLRAVHKDDAEFRKLVGSFQPQPEPSPSAPKDDSVIIEVESHSDSNNKQ